MAIQILTGDSLDQGRIKINHAFSAQTDLFSGSTGTNSIIANNYTGNVALGSNSVILGYNNTSTGNTSTIAGGTSNLINDLNESFIGSGFYNKIISPNFGVNFIGGGSTNLIGDIGINFIGGGYYNIITPGGGLCSIVGGTTNYIKSAYSVICGGEGNSIDETATTAEYCIIGGGLDNIITANYGAVLGGRGNEAAHTHSVAFGGGSKTRNNFNVVIGGTDTSTPSTTNNTIRFAGDTGDIVYEGTCAGGSADYAECFEWKDKNLDNEDRRGLFVSLIEGKIKIGNFNILGVVSSHPLIVGDAQENRWKDIYIKNDWGDIVMEKYNVYKSIKYSDLKTYDIYVNSSGTKYFEYPNPSHPLGILCNEEIPKNLVSVEMGFPKMNPLFNKEEEYIPRKDRPEWSAIGMLGKLLVRTSEKITSNFIDADSNGYAVNGTTYHVLKIIRPYTNPYGIVQILFK